MFNSNIYEKYVFIYTYMHMYIHMNTITENRKGIYKIQYHLKSVPLVEGNGKAQLLYLLLGVPLRI